MKSYTSSVFVAINKIFLYLFQLLYLSILYFQHFINLLIHYKFCLCSINIHHYLHCVLFSKVCVSLIYAPLFMFVASHVAQKQALTFDWWLWLHVVILICCIFILSPTSKTCYATLFTHVHKRHVPLNDTPPRRVWVWTLRLCKNKYSCSHGFDTLFIITSGKHSL